MRITYDPEVDALYIRFRETTVTTQHLAEGLAADYDAEGHLAGIEILDVTNRLGGKDTFKQVVLENIALARHQLWNKQKALEAIKKLKGSGNGRLVEALLKERSAERTQKEE